MLHIIAFAALASTAAPPIVSTDWLQAHLTDPQVRVICVWEVSDLVALLEAAESKKAA